MIRPAEAGTYDPEIARAYVEPGTGPGVGEVQVFVHHDGRELRNRVVAEEAPFLARTQSLGSGPDFVITSSPERMRPICDRMVTRFDEEIGLHYNFKHRKQGYLEVPDDNGGTRQAPLMSLSIGVLTSADGPFYDIRELSETVEEARQRAMQQAREQSRRSTVAFGRK